MRSMTRSMKNSSSALKPLANPSSTKAARYDLQTSGLSKSFKTLQIRFVFIKIFSVAKRPNPSSFNVDRGTDGEI